MSQAMMMKNKNLWWKSTKFSRICQNEKIFAKQNTFETTKSLIWVILGCNCKKILSYLESANATFSRHKVSCKTKNFNHLGIFKLEFEKTIVIFEIINIELLKIQSFVKMLKSVNMGTKMPYLGYF